jgi:hypothetical protein
MPALLLVALALTADKPTPLPADWHGTWTGTFVISGPADKSSEAPVVMVIEPIKDSAAVTWKTTFGKGEKEVVKDYTLVPVADKPGRFVVDEKNGIELAARLVNGVLYSTFEVGGAVLTARYELRDKAIRFEITSAKPAKAKTGDGQVQDYPVDVVQAAELKRK